MTSKTSQTQLHVQILKLTILIDVRRCCLYINADHDSVVRVATLGAYMNTQWETCQSTVAGCLLDSTDPANTAPYSSNQTCAQGSVPVGHINIQSPTDAILAFEMAKKLNVSLVIRNTGHDYKGRSSSPHSIALSTHLLTNMSYSAQFVPDGCSTSYSGITVGAGVIFQDFYTFAEEQNVTVVGGSDPTVGVAGGFLQGGGVTPPITYSHVVMLRYVTTIYIMSCHLFTLA